MSWKVPVDALNAHLEALLDAASAGEMIIVRRPGKPDVRIMSEHEWGSTSESLYLLGHPVNAARMFASAGYYERLEDGRFAITEAGWNAPKPEPPR